MNKSTEKKTVLDHIDFSDYPKELNTVQDFTTTDILKSIIVVILIISALLILLLLNSAFLFVIILFYFTFLCIFGLIPKIWIFTKITLRTKCTFFVWELFHEFLFLTWLVLILLVFLQFIEAFSFIDVRLLTFMFSIIWFLVFIQKEGNKRNPIINLATTDISKAPIISIHSIEIKEEQDGYSQRPISSDFQLLTSIIPSSSDFKNQLENYCAFLGKKGELIDWHIEESFAILYPRFVIRSPNLFRNPLFYYHLLRKVRKKEEITSIEISLSPPHMSINIAFQDYDILNRETTFHSLCLHILESVKQSLTAFLNNDLDTAYHELTRGRETAFIQTVIIFNIFSSSYDFLAKIYTTVLKRKKKEI